MRLLGYFDRFEEHSTGVMALVSVSIVLNLGFGILVPFIPIFAQNIGASVGLIGFIISAFTIGRAVAASIAGDYSDKIGRKRVMFVGTVVYAVATAAMALAKTWQVLLGLRILEGIAVGIVWPTAQAHLIDLVPKERVGEATGLYTTTLSFGFFAGPLIGSSIFFVAELLGASHLQALTAPFYATGGIALLSSILVFFVIHDVDPIEEERVPNTKYMDKSDAVVIKPTVPQPTKEYKKFYSMAMLNGVGIGFIIPIFAIFFVDVHGFSEAAVGVILGIGGGIMTVLSGPSGYLSDKIGKRPLMLVGVPLMVVSMTLLGFVSTFLMAGTYFWIRSIGNGLFIPSFRALQAEVVLPHERGKIFGRTQTFFNMGAVIGPIVGSYIYDILSGNTYSILGFSLLGEAVPFILTGIFQSLIVLIILTLKFPELTPPGVAIEVEVSNLEPEETSFVLTE